MRSKAWWLIDGLVVLVLALAVATWRFDLGDAVLGEPVDPQESPAAVDPPRGVQVVAGAPAPAVAPVATGSELDPAKVQAALAPYLGGRKLGPHYAVLVTDLQTGREVYRSGAATITPASITKVLTGAAALEALGPMTRLRTVVRWVPARNELVLVGGGDPLLASSRAAVKGLYPPRADLATLAKQTAAALAEQPVDAAAQGPLRLVFDDSLFTGPRVNPDWPASYIPEGVAPPTTALWADQGKQRDGFGFVADPAAEAASLFAAQLRRAGVEVTDGVVRGTAPATATELTAVHSAPIGELVERALLVSDNQIADVLAHHVGIAESGTGSFEAGAAAVTAVLGRIGAPITEVDLHDGSGLSRLNVVPPETVAGVLRAAAERPELRQVLTGMPVAGFTGSLSSRFAEEPAAARGRVRAKTGTLTGVHGLAGVAEDQGGRPMAFVAVADRVPVPRTLEVRRQVDRIAAALGACTCHVGS